MPEVESVVKIDEKDIPVSTPITNVDDATIKAMAAKSGDTEEHIRKMLGLHSDHKVVEQEKKVDDPAKAAEDKLLAGKYKTQEDLDKGFQSLVDKYGKETAYKMLEKGLGKADIDASKGAVDGATDALDAKTPEQIAAEADAAKAAAESKPIDMNKYFNEFGDKGELSIESYKELQDAGFDKALVDSYIEGKQAQGELYTSKVHSLAGGEQQFNAMVEWGTKNLTPAQKTAFNSAVSSGDINQATTVLDALKARYVAAEGSFTRKTVDISSSIDSNSNVQGYQSRHEMEADMRDPRYRSGDRAFIANVQKKLAVSRI